MTNLLVELNLETVISFSAEDDAALMAAAEYIKKNWFKFVDKYKDLFVVKVFCELEE